MAIYRILAENRAVFGGEKFSRRIRSEYIDGDQVAAKTVKRVSKAMAGEALRAR